MGIPNASERSSKLRFDFPANVSSYVRSSCEEAANLAEESDVKAPITSLITRTEKLEAIPEGIEKVLTESAYFCANGSCLSSQRQYLYK